MSYGHVNAGNLSAMIVNLEPFLTTSTSGLPNATAQTSNSTSGLLLPTAEPSTLETVFTTIVMITIMSMAIFGNSLVIVSVFKFERLRIIANSFIVSLAFADLLVAILVMPFNASQAIAGHWVFNKVMCDIFNANDVLFSTASLLHLCCISMDRYIAIMDPFHYESKMTKKRAGVMLMSAWGASGLISHIPIHMGWYTTEEQKTALELDTQSCSFKVNKIYAVVSSCISFWTPAIIMVFTYVKIFREARRQEKQIYLLTKQSAPSLERLRNDNVSENGASGHKNGNNITNRRLTQDRRKMKREHKAAKTLGVIMGAFLFCWLPFFLWYVITNMCDSTSCHPPNILVDILFWIGYFNSALNPIIYAFCNRDFRNAFKRLLRCHKLHLCRRRRPETNVLRFGTELPDRPSRQDMYDQSSSPSPRSKRFYDTVEQPSL